MKRAALVILLAAATLGAAGVAAPAVARGHHGGGGPHGGRGGHGFPGHGFHHHRFFGGPVIVAPWFGVWGAPFWYPPPVVIQPAPQVYVQPPAPTYWYYCPDARAYYPYVQECPGGWLTVVPRPPQ